MVDSIQGSIIKVVRKNGGDMDIEVVDKGRWIAGTITEEEGVRSTWAPERAPSRLEENTEFFTAEGGLWIPTVSKFFKTFHMCA